VKKSVIFHQGPHKVIFSATQHSRVSDRPGSRRFYEFQNNTSLVNIVL